MVYIVFIDTTRGSAKHSTCASYTDTRQQVKALREAGHRAWWEFKPDHACFVTGHALAQPRFVEVL